MSPNSFPNIQTIENPIVSREFGIPGKVSSGMLNRAVETVGKHMEEIVSASAFFLTKRYDLPHTDCNIDASSLSVYSKQSDLFSFGYSRDKRPDLRQVNFAVAEIGSPVNLPIGLTVSPGNTPDGKQFVELLENIRLRTRKLSRFGRKTASGHGSGGLKAPPNRET